MATDHRMFIDLPDLEIGDTFTVETYGEQILCRLVGMAEVLPHETKILIPDSSRDLITLIIYTPIRASAERMLVTGERTQLPAHES